VRFDGGDFIVAGVCLAVLLIFSFVFYAVHQDNKNVGACRVRGYAEYDISAERCFNRAYEPATAERAK
jgi:hypothetical protein